MTAHHYEDFITGIGSTGYLMDAAWPIDAHGLFKIKTLPVITSCLLLQILIIPGYGGGIFFYGFIEFYFNGIGDENYSKAIYDPTIERLTRGELFVLAGNIFQPESR